MKGSKTGVSRRELGAAAFVAASGAVASTLAGAQAPPVDNFATAARQQTQRNSELLRNFEVPTATEPSFLFRP